MEQITLHSIQKNKNQIKYDFSVSDGLKKYFSGLPFVIEYPENIDSVPDSICAVPFVCNVLPIIWLTDSTLKLNELDEAFYNCIPEVRHGYEIMYPESKFNGLIQAEKIISCDRSTEGKSATFFSGGLDAVSTLVTHIDEHPSLISIWGADIKYENTEGWERVHSAIKEYADHFGLSDIAIRSSFRNFDNEGVLQQDFYDQLTVGWWYGIKHGIGLLGHAAPYAYLHGLSNIYIASSNCPADGPQRCASDPKTDNHVRFANAKVFHDGFELNRQDKAHNVVQYSKTFNERLPLHVCWISQSGGNCCQCEKCYRTMTELLAEGADPVDYNFLNAHSSISKMHSFMLIQGIEQSYANAYWIPAQESMLNNITAVKKLPYWKQIRWIINTDFTNSESLKPPLLYRLRTKLSHFRVYRALGQVRRKLHG